MAVSLVVTCVGAAIIVMLSGYATGGEVAFPLAGSIAGASVATLLLARSSRATGPIGIAVVGLFSVLVMGHFFGELTTPHAALLLFAPCLAGYPRHHSCADSARGYAVLLAWHLSFWLS